MAALLVLAAAVLSLCASFGSCEVNYTNCDTDITILENALYTPENIKQLNEIFYPPRKQPSKFVKVHYNFEDLCNVTYIWAIGGFLLMQPPSIFQYTSLYFSPVTNDLLHLNITLPRECLPLVQNCSCNGDDNNLLDILTQQLNVYAKYNDRTQVIRDDTFRVKAICSEELRSEYYTKITTGLFLACTLVMPAFFIIAIATIVRSFHEQIDKELGRRENHGNFAALTTVGVLIQVVIIGIDIVAVVHVFGKRHELNDEDVVDEVHNSDYDVLHTFNGFITLITLCFDSIVGSVMFLCLVYLWCMLCHKDSSKNCRNCGDWAHFFLVGCLPCCLHSCFYTIFGSIEQGRVWHVPENYDSEDTQRFSIRRTSWVLLIMLVSPLFSIASHGGYILAAWLTEPSKATETALIAMALLVYASLILRQCYVANADIDLKWRCWSFLMLFVFVYPILYVTLHCIQSCKVCLCYYKELIARISPTDNILQEEENEEEELADPLQRRGKRTSKLLNIQALCIVLGWGVWVALSLLFTIYAFDQVPLSTLHLATYLLNIFQIFIVIITALIAYKIFMLSEPELQRFVKKARFAYENKAGKKDVENEDDLEALGIVTGNALDALIKRV